jgi:transcriptional regulator with XRE-family HTH domain
MSAFSVSYGARPAASRRRAGMSQEAFGSHVGLSRPSVANVEAGRQMPSAEQVLIHSAILDVDPGWLLTGSRKYLRKAT